MSRDPSTSPLVLLLSAWLVATTTACPGSLEAPERFTPRDGGPTSDGGGEAEACPSGLDVPMDILVAKCGDSACHDGTSPSAGLDLVSAGLLPRLVDVDSPNPSCAGQKLINTAAVDDSLLLDKVTAMPSCGGAMPLGTMGLSSEEYQCLRAWIIRETGASTAQGGNR